MPVPTDENSIYFYYPSFPATIIFTILFLFPSLWLVYLFLSPKYKNQTFTSQQDVAKRRPPRSHFIVPALVGSLLEVAGYIVRAASVKNVESIPVFATQSSLIVIAPLFLTASIYVLVSRLIIASPSASSASHTSFLHRIHQHLLHKPRTLARIFITSDILSLLTQCSGSGIASSGNWDGNVGKIGTDVLIAGLAIQVASFGIFLGGVVWWGWGIRKKGERKWIMRMVYVVGALIMIRSIYRLVEFALGIWGYPFAHEWMFYVLEAAPMIAAWVVFCAGLSWNGEEENGWNDRDVSANGEVLAL